MTKYYYLDALKWLVLRKKRKQAIHYSDILKQNDLALKLVKCLFAHKILQETLSPLCYFFTRLVYWHFYAKFLSYLKKKLSEISKRKIKSFFCGLRKVLSKIIFQTIFFPSCTYRAAWYCFFDAGVNPIEEIQPSKG